ncbi:MAG: pyridoxamine 5'-phosphate oxidase family protein [Caldiserica bacterium]|nr:pyridoxamine 5'-phosphate oxidase family protein [Caldisericota bacterium]
MITTSVLYASRYGTTRDIARALARILGPARALPVEELIPAACTCEFVVIGTPIYAEVPDPGVVRFVEDHLPWLTQRKVALFTSSLAPDSQGHYRTSLSRLIGPSLVSGASLGGRLDVASLDTPDRAAMEAFASMTHSSLTNADTLNWSTVAAWGLQLKEIRDSLGCRLESGQVRAEIDRFLCSHNTCGLATAGAAGARSTPIEYVYAGDCLYFLREGGAKFANLLLNQHVSICIFDPYHTMADVAGLQLTGTARLVDAQEAAADSVLQAQHLTREKLGRLPFELNIIEVRLERAELLLSALSKRGVDSRQVYNFAGPS